MASRRFSVRNTAVFSCARPTNSTPSAPRELGQVLVHHVVLASPLWPLAKSTHGTALVTGEAVHRGDERLGDPGQRRGRGDRQPELPMHVPDQPRGVLQLRHVDVQVHPVDALHLDDHMLGQDIGDGCAVAS